MADVSKLILAAETTARDILAGVDVLAKVLAEQLREAHGGEWRVRIDHKEHYLSIRQVRI